MIKSRSKITARLELGVDGGGRMSSVFGELDIDISVPPVPAIIEEKLAILKLADIGARIPNVGKRQSRNIFYLWFTEDEVRQIKQIKQESDNARQGSDSQYAGFVQLSERIQLRHKPSWIDDWGSDVRGTMLWELRLKFDEDGLDVA